MPALPAARRRTPESWAASQGSPRAIGATGVLAHEAFSGLWMGGRLTPFQGPISL